jgi:GntR family transcriptional regulator, transcriptional repressor for pyruvate dehydrogenase complex
MGVRAVRRGESLVERATAELARQITAGEWKVGDRLPGEVELAGQLGIGRSTMREALRTLVASGQLEARQGAGTFVASLTAVSDLERKLRRAEVVDAYEVRVGLELQAGELAARRRTADDIAALRSAWDARCAAADRDDFVEADLAFHRAVVAATHNPVLIEVFASFSAALRHALRELHDDPRLRDGTRGETHDAHVDLLTAIVDGDPDAAVAATRANVAFTLDQLRLAQIQDG